ncbi:hypothetical protein MLS01_26360, partial [Escherichia coli]|nr:hypothetical protein [Escherichia coli]
RLIQNQSYPFVMSVDVASDSFMQTAEMLLEKNATLTIWQGVIPLRYVTGVVAGLWHAGEQRLADALSPAY